MRLNLLTLALAGALAATPALAQVAEIDGARVTLERVMNGLERPVAVVAPDGDSRLFVVEKTGRILVVADGAFLAEPFLDLTGAVGRGNEQGLLGLAFHPDYATNGRFFVNYTDRSGDTQVVAYTVSADPARADPESAATLLTVEQPYANHNGGWLGFGPDGYLYIGLGDGGAGGDPHGNGQNPDVLLGKILRIDVDGGSPYAIPPDNPFATGGGAPEVFLTGLRNPWRAGFDGELLYIGDVGQGAFEEIDVVSPADAGANLGWNTLEGSACYPAGSVCAQGGFLMPVHVYPHPEGCSVTGGVVYRGAALPELAGRYFFADYCAGALESFRYADGAATGHVTADGLGSVGPVTSFGTDAAGELYLVLDTGDVLKLVRAP